MDTGDPWDWSVDRVVQEFSPEPVQFEKTLRENEVLGCVLLLHVDDGVLKGDFGIKSLGQRAFVRCGIDALRLRSVKYQAHIQQNQLNIAPSPHSQSMQTELLQIIRAAGITTGHAPQILPAGNAQPNPLANALQFEPLPNLVPAGPSNIPVINSTQIEGVVSEEPGNKRQKLDSPDPTAIVDHQYDQSALGQVNNAVDQEVVAGQDGTPTPPPEIMSSPALEVNGKKRKRIAPTLISSQINFSRNRDIPTAADDVIYNDPLNIEPGVAFIGEDGRKRLIPVRQRGDQPDETYRYEDMFQHPISEAETPSIASSVIPTTESKKLLRRCKSLTEALSAGYLGKRKMAVDDVFFGSTAVGQDLSLSDDAIEFNVMDNISSGRRLYMNSLMKHYLRAEPSYFMREDKNFSSITPYSSRLAPLFSKQSFTLFYFDADGKVHARREEVPSWPEVDPNISMEQLQKLGDERSARFNPMGPNVLDGFGRYEEVLDPSYLEKKYSYLEGGDEVLPLYGESDEENEYDLATWKEIEEELGEKLDRPLGRTKKVNISGEEVVEAIDEGIAELVKMWKEKTLPKRLKKAYRLWRKSRVHGTKREQIIAAQQDLKHIIQRIANMRKEIINDVWTSKAQVQKQTGIMEPDVFTREDLTWKISLLEQKFSPEKPLATQPIAELKQSSNRSGFGEEGESIGSSESEAESSDDGLDDFIIPDELLPTTEQEQHELNLADSEDDDEDEDAAMSDPSSSDESGKEASSINAIKPQKSNQTRIASDESSPPPFKVNAPAVKEEFSLPAHLKPAASSPPQIYDLTMLSSDDNQVIDLVTPLKKKPRLIIRNSDSPFRNRLFRSSPINLMDSDEDAIPDSANLPSLNDPAAVSKFSFIAWARLFDSERLLIKVIYNMVDTYRTPMLSLLSNLSESDLWTHIDSVMTAFSTEQHVSSERLSLRGIDSSTFDYLKTSVKLFEIYIDCCYHPFQEPPSQETISKVRQKKAEKFLPFYNFCSKLERYFAPTSPSTPTPAQMNGKDGNSKGKSKVTDLTDEEDDDDDPRPPFKRCSQETTASEDELPLEDIPHKKHRAKPIFENAEARGLRELDRERLSEQEKRREQLRLKLAQSGHANDEDQGLIIINDAAGEGENHHYINHEIAKRIKKHQIEGARFLWNQIVTVADEEAMQGCLLAHTMGLGKTMQVITLLTAIAEAAASIDPSISSQIPKKLQRSQTLILCPPTLIDNWMDELLTWAPVDTLGELRKISNLPPKERLRQIADWNEDGGVLIIGYEMFRTLVTNPKRKGQEESPLSEEEHDLVLKHLLEGPNIIIADEAHKMKNTSSGISKAASRFKSKSRIALTASPLANNVEEYHSMIDWVAPNYLGPIVEFRAKYVEPIQIGLWTDSTDAEYRRALKMLGVLFADLAPKVHRADISVLRNDLPQKKEFVITVPLTELQRKAYSLYVQSMTSGKGISTTKSGEVTSSTVWHWLAVLSLICNHPQCFDAKIHERKEKAKQNSIAKDDVSSPIDSSDGDGGMLDINAPAWKIGVSAELVNAASNLFREEAIDMDSIDLSYKAQILCQILDASKLAGDKCLVFSQSLVTLDFLERLCKRQGRRYARLDGKTQMNKRQSMTKNFNTGTTEVYLISTTAGGLGLNLPGANRVIIFDFKWNPVHEEQAVGRAYRIGQKKKTFVYRFVAGGTFEDSVHNKTIFKLQLASRVVDRKHPVSQATRKLSDFLFEPKNVPQHDLAEFKGMDPLVLDKILASQATHSTIRNIVQTDTFERDDDKKLTAEEEREMQMLIKDEKMKREDPIGWNNLKAKRQAQQAAQRHKEMERQAQQMLQQRQQQGSQQVASQQVVSGSQQGKPQQGQKVQQLPSKQPTPPGIPQVTPTPTTQHKQPSTQQPLGANVVLTVGTNILGNTVANTPDPPRTLAKDVSKESPAVLHPPRPEYLKPSNPESPKVTTPSIVQSTKPLAGPSNHSPSSQSTLTVKKNNGENVSSTNGGSVKSHELSLALEGSAGKQENPRKIFKPKVSPASLIAGLSHPPKPATPRTESSTETSSRGSRSSPNGASSGAKPPVNIETPSPESRPSTVVSRTPPKASIGSSIESSNKPSNQNSRRPQGKGTDLRMSLRTNLTKAAQVPQGPASLNRSKSAQEIAVEFENKIILKIEASESDKNLRLSMVRSAVRLLDDLRKGQSLLNSELSINDFVDEVVKSLKENSSSLASNDITKVGTSHTSPDSGLPAKEQQCHVSTMAADTQIAGPGSLPLSNLAPRSAPTTTVPNVNEPRGFGVLSFNELQNVLERHGLSVDRTQSDLIARCTTKQQEPAAKSVAAEVPKDQVHPILANEAVATDVSSDDLHPMAANEAAQERAHHASPPSVGTASSNPPSLMARIFKSLA